MYLLGLGMTSKNFSLVVVSKTFGCVGIGPMRSVQFIGEFMGILQDRGRITVLASKMSRLHLESMVVGTY